MMRIVIMGTGNVSYHFFKAFNSLDKFRVTGVYSRTPNPGHYELYGELLYHDIALTPDADLYILAISDDAISSFSEQLPFKNKLVIHTSGVTSMEALCPHNRRGVLYPVQSISRGKEINYREMPLGFEAENETDLEILKDLANSISSKTYLLKSDQRKQLHLAAVFVNNFTNHLYYIGEQICRDHKIPFEVLQPLILETVEKLDTLTPFEAQTGPARRNDIKSINSHLEIVKDGTFKKIYEILTRSIQEIYGREKL